MIYPNIQSKARHESTESDCIAPPIILNPEHVSHGELELTTVIRKQMLLDQVQHKKTKSDRDPSLVD